MAEITSQTVGNVVDIPEVKAMVCAFAKQWQVTNPNPKKSGLKVATRFLLDCVDEFIALVEEYISSGPDKKATVLAALSMLYDFVVFNALPLWLKPFASQIKTFIITVLASELIDFVVAKYKKGSWIKPTLPEEAHGTESTAGGGHIEGSADTKQG